jgi:hypothetical protein
MHDLHVTKVVDHVKGVRVMLSAHLHGWRYAKVIEDR